MKSKSLFVQVDRDRQISCLKWFIRSFSNFVLAVTCLVCAATAEEITVIDPPDLLTRVLADWREDNDLRRTNWFFSAGSFSAEEENGYLMLQREGTLRLNTEFHPNQYPYIRLRAGGGPDDSRTMRISASPNEEENERVVPLPLENGGGEYFVRLPPDRILTKDKYDGEGIELQITDGGRLALDYIMADAVPTRALAEFDSKFPEKFLWKGDNEPKAGAGLLRIEWEAAWSLVFAPRPLPSTADWNAIELRCRLENDGGSERSLSIQWTNEEGQSGEFSWTIPADGDFHTFRTYLYKVDYWKGSLETISLNAKDADPPLDFDVDYLRLRRFPEPGGGNISRGIRGLTQDNASDWSESAKLINHWRFVAGQSYGGNQALAWRSIGRPFMQNSIRWETDHPTWNWLLDRKDWPLDENRNPDLKEAARLAFEHLNKAAIFLDNRHSRLDAVHFDGLFRRLLMPLGSVHHGHSDEEGLLDHTNGDFEEAYALAAETFCEMMVLARTDSESRLRDTKFYIQPNLHVWKWEYGVLEMPSISTRSPNPGNFVEMMDALIECDQRYEAEGRYDGPSPLAGFGADWMFMNVNSQNLRLVSFEWHATENGYEFNVANNGFMRRETPEERAEDSVDYLMKFRSRGGRPTRYTPYWWHSTWRSAPDYGQGGHAVLPESESFTVMNTILASARKALYLDEDSIPDTEQP